MSKVFTLAYGGIGAGVVSHDIITNNPPPPLTLPPVLQWVRPDTTGSRVYTSIIWA